jgi:hypothetical protein
VLMSCVAAGKGYPCQVAQTVWRELQLMALRTPTAKRPSTLSARIEAMRKTLIITTVATVLVSACGRLPTGAPASPRFDGGVFGGSGNVVAVPPATPTGSATTSPDAAADSSSSRSGVFGGSGN